MTTPFDLGDKVAIVSALAAASVAPAPRRWRGSAPRWWFRSRKADACEAVGARLSRIRRGGAAVVPCNIAHKDEAAALVAETLCIYVVSCPPPCTNRQG